MPSRHGGGFIPSEDEYETVHHQGNERTADTSTGSPSVGTTVGSEVFSDSTTEPSAATGSDAGSSISGAHGGGHIASED